MRHSVAQPLGRYAVHGELASGGMASVHFARLMGPAGFTRTVALKRPHPQLAKEREFAMMFIDEARLAARIRHPNVVSTLDVIETPSELAIVMDYVHGESLSRLSAAARLRGERVPVPIAAAILIDVLHGLHAAHEATDEQGRPLGIVHRDVSPQNVIVGADGISRIADFGIAKAAGRLQTTEDGVIKGKYAYMAPEQVRGEEVSRLTDVYAASIVLWELLTGQPLFRGQNQAESLYNCLEAPIPPPSAYAPDLPPVLDEILLRGLTREPSGRYPSARALASELERAAPAVRASEIGAWVERLAGETLAARATVIADMERSGPAGYAELMPTVPSSGAPGAGSDLSQVSQISNAGVVAERLGRTSAERRPMHRAPLIALAALLCGLLGTFIVVRPRLAAAPPSPAGSLAPPAPGSMTAPSLASESITASPAPPVPASAPAAPAASPAPSASVAAHAGPAASGKAVLSRPAARGASKKGSAACDPPYTMDSQGREIFKVECL